MSDEKVWSAKPITLSYDPQVGMRIEWRGKIYRIQSEQNDTRMNKQITLIREEGQ